MHPGGKRLTMTTARADKQADLAGPDIGNYEELEKILPQDYQALLTPKETQQAIFAIKNYMRQDGRRTHTSTAEGR
jgi:hypothetical protein